MLLLVSWLKVGAIDELGWILEIILRYFNIESVQLCLVITRIIREIKNRLE